MLSTGALLGVYLGLWSSPHGSWSGSARWAAALAQLRWCREGLILWGLAASAVSGKANHPKILPTWHCLKFPHDLQHFFLPKTPPKTQLVWKTPRIVVFFSLSPLGEFELKRDYLVGTSPGRSELWHWLVVVVNGRWGPTVWPSVGPCRDERKWGAEKPGMPWVSSLELINRFPK